MNDTLEAYLFCANSFLTVFYLQGNSLAQTVYYEHIVSHPGLLPGL
jgi:hypothetical protein